MNNCSISPFIDSSYLASPNFVAFSCHIITIIEIPLSIYGAYCILFQTPAKMKPVQFLILNLHFWNTLSDLFLCFIGIPFLYLPSISGFDLGLLESPAVTFYVGVTLVLAMIAAVLSIYENRFYKLFAHKTTWKHIRKAYLIAVYTSIPFIFLPPFLTIPEQETAQSFILAKLPCLPKFTFNDEELFVLSISPVIPLLCIAFASLFLAVPIITFFSMTLYHLLTKKKLVTLSAKTLAIHRKFLKSVSIQSISTAGIVLVPLTTFICFMMFWYHNQKLNNLGYLVLSLHGSVSTIVMILVHKPYRDFTFSLCWKPQRNSPTIIVTDKSNQLQNSFNVVV
ncbi:Serpentine Receptor, class H [Caenorhabditis elegans]|uniref:Serpentine Receptor, class H n=1 Tax=Caenorhabditis elegans TaxID=6239 RepID=O45165_CAEEL|nr:Serpentine Receptor, class H [Caenorhabditis elegans]CCD66315.1 Serpentine Receptor, class H [Caenorhabditis elegans]|eukprot:NP_503779.1 Serpentine Receptor, class H [Caenorhabditis elegans]